jgi:glycolate oxidase iron-sulfur subunit
MAACPLYGLLGREPAVARGKLNLWAHYREGALASGPLLREVLECCLLCGACSASCAVNLPVPELIKAARRDLRLQEGRHWSPALLLAHLTWQAPHLIPALAPAAPLLNRLKSWLGADSGLPMRLWPHLAALSQMLPPLSPRPFRALAPARVPGRGPLKVAFFVGCGIEALFPQVGQAFLAICRHLGIEVVIPESQGCCGLLAESVGEMELAQALGRRFLKDFAHLPGDYVVVACAACSYQLKRLGRLFADTPETEVARRLAGKVKEVSEFLVQVAGYQPRVRPGLEGLAFHDPCHLHRGQGLSQEPRELLQAAAGVALLEPRERVCCGQGGAFGVLYPELSRQLGLARHQHFQEVGALLVATSCSGCLLQLKSTAGSFRVAHLLELVAPPAEKNGPPLA